jgi:hypothetical protein
MYFRCLIHFINFRQTLDQLPLLKAGSIFGNDQFCFKEQKDYKGGRPAYKTPGVAKRQHCLAELYRIVVWTKNPNFIVISMLVQMFHSWTGHIRCPDMNLENISYLELTIGIPR